MHPSTAALLLVLCITAAFWDLAWRRIPNWLTVAAFLLAIAIRGLAGGEAILMGLGGAALAFLLLVPLVALGGLGGGDAKLLIAVGALLGPTTFLWALGLSALYGGVMALLVTARRGVILPALLSTGSLLRYGLTFGRAGQAPSTLDPAIVRIPYGVAIAAGTLTAFFLHA